MEKSGAIARCLAVLALVASSTVGQAAPVTVGDNDFFGNGVVGQSGDSFDSIFGITSDSPTDATDNAYADQVVLRFQYQMPVGGIDTARLVVFAGGWGAFGVDAGARVLFNGFDIGSLTDGDNENAFNPFATETAHLDQFVLDLSQVTLTGDDEVVISVLQGSDPLTLDFGAVDYAFLDITPLGDPGGGTAPEPASLALALLGLAAAGAVRRRMAR